MKSKRGQTTLVQENSLGDFIYSLIEKHDGAWLEQFRRFVQNKIAPLSGGVKTLSLFSGAGGLDIGFHDAGFEIVESIEIEDKFVQTLKANSGESKYFGKNFNPKSIDIRKYVPPKNLKVDFIIGGPPCQTFSAAGRRAEGVLGTTESRGTLFEEYVRLLKELQPKGFLFENVYGIAGAEKGGAWKKITESFSNAGYTVHFRILSASDYGVPQHRERMFIVGTKNIPYFFPRPTHGPDGLVGVPYFSANDAIQGLTKNEKKEENKINGRYGHLLNEIPPGLNYSFFTEKMGHPKPIFAWRSKFSDFLYKADPDSPIRTLKASGGQYTGPFHWDNRHFTIEELKRLQTFPDNYEIIGNHQTLLKQIGNSVPPQIARILAISILEQIFKVPLPFKIQRLKSNEGLEFRKRKNDLTELYNRRAKEAISRLKNVSNNSIINAQYYSSLNDNFSFKMVEQLESDFKVISKVSNSEWIIELEVKSTLHNPFEILITGEWTLPVKTIVLRSNNLTPKTFTGVWKALENEISRHGYKADLVQLNGYYQYEPQFRCKMKFGKDLDQKWKVVRNIVEGKGVRVTLASKQLYKLWEIDDSENILEIAIFLKTIGYEIRNNMTNPQIPKDNYIAPYHFPTLTPLSVQLTKALK